MKGDIKVKLAVYKLVPHEIADSTENCLDDSNHILLKIRLENLDNKSKLFLVYVNAMVSFNLFWTHQNKTPFIAER